MIISRGDQRFVELRDFNFEAVLDQETSLVWEKEPSPVDRNWQQAQNHCTSLFKGGRGGWRLPTIQELTSLKTTPSFEDPMPAGHPFVFPIPIAPYTTVDYWSATSSESRRTQPDRNGPAAWVFSVSDGAIYFEDKKGPDNEQAWCVRFRQGVNLQ